MIHAPNRSEASVKTLMVAETEDDFNVLKEERLVGSMTETISCVGETSVEGKSRVNIKASRIVTGRKKGYFI